MEQVVAQCNDAQWFPQNFAGRNTLEYKLASYFEQLNEHQARLFSKEDDAAFGFRDLDSDAKGLFVLAKPAAIHEQCNNKGDTAFWSLPVKSAITLRSHLRIDFPSKRPDPLCRFLFINAPHSRESLKTTRKMLVLAFTYFQVMPEFLDFLFAFGKQAHAQDLYCSGLRQRAFLTDSDVGVCVPELGWSGRELQVCYNLKSVEKSSVQRDWPWSIRHCATHHTFDVKNVRATWIIIKSDQLMERRIHAATSDRGPVEFSSFQTIEKAFAAALATHLLLCDWSAENWRWYIKFLEDKLQEMTRGAITINADIPLSPAAEADYFTMQPRQMTNKTQRTTQSSFSVFSRARTQASESFQTQFEKKPPPPSRTYTNLDGKKQPLPPGFTVDGAQSPRPEAMPYESYGQQQFSFSDLQKTQDIEEKANETALVLRLNLNVISQLRRYYRCITQSQDFPKSLAKNSVGNMVGFERQIDGIESDMQLQVLRVEALVQLLAERKTLLRGLLDFHNTQANKLLAHQSQKSTKNMERLTHDMSEVAHKTKSETVSMKIITLVTLFFLPGTFISTLMSTDIVHWDRTNGTSAVIFKLGALQVYLAISLPFMLATFGIWYIFHWMEKRKLKDNKERLLADMAWP